MCEDDLCRVVFYKTGTFHVHTKYFKELMQKMEHRIINRRDLEKSDVDIFWMMLMM